MGLQAYSDQHVEKIGLIDESAQRKPDATTHDFNESRLASVEEQEASRRVQEHELTLLDAQRAFKNRMIQH